MKVLIKNLNKEFIEVDNLLKELQNTILTKKGNQDKILNQLKKIYQNSDTVIRLRIIAEIIGINYKPSYELLKTALKSDSSPLVRHEAAFAIGIANDLSLQDDLIEATKNDPDPVVRHESAIALTTIAGEASLPTLIEATKDPEEIVYNSAKYAIQTILTKAHNLKNS